MIRVAHRYLYNGFLYKDLADLLTGRFRARPFVGYDKLITNDCGRRANYEDIHVRLRRDVFEAEAASPPDGRMYAALFHLSCLIRKSPTPITLCDLGGSAGQHFYQFKSYLPLDRIQSWTVIDLPKITQMGRYVALERNQQGLNFSTEFRAAEGCDILYSAGTLQVIGDPFFADIAALQHKPRYVLLNNIEIADHTFHSQQLYRRKNMYIVMTTYSETDLITRMGTLSYDCIEHWRLGNSGHRPIFSSSDFIIWSDGFLFRLVTNSD